MLKISRALQKLYRPIFTLNISLPLFLYCSSNGLVESIKRSIIVWLAIELLLKIVISTNGHLAHGIFVVFVDAELIT